MSNEVLTDRKLVLAVSGGWYQQAVFGDSLDESLIDKRQPQTTPAFHALILTKEATKDCSGEYIKKEKISSRIVKFTIGFDVTADLFFYLVALGYGTVGAPSGTPQNEKQLFKSTATAGVHRFLFEFEGLADTSVDVPFNATPAQLKNALEQMRPIKRNNLTVTGTALNHVAGLTVEYGGHLANANFPLMTVDNTDATGGTAAVTAIQNGANKLHAATRMTGEKPPKTSVIEGFEGSTGGAKLYKDLVIAKITGKAVRRGKFTVTIVAYANANYELLDDYEMPDCIEVDPILVADCRFEKGGVFAADDLQECGFDFDNNIVIDESAFRSDDIDIDELEKGDRTSQFTAQVLGTDVSDWYTFAEDFDNAFDDCALHIGRPGERVSFFAPNAQFALDETPIQFIGTKRKSAFNLTATPRPNDGDGIVDRAEYHGAQTVQYLRMPA